MKRSVVSAVALATAGAGVAVAVAVAASPSAAAACTGYVALTFDDGPNASNTNTLLNTLKSAGARATLFNIGQNAASNASLVQAEKNAGMWIGNHSYTHQHMTSLSQSSMQSELQRTQQAIANAGGGTPNVFRPPYGEHNGTLDSVASSLGLRTVTWDVDSQDWNGASTASIVNAANSLQNGGIMLMHDQYSTTIQAIPQIVSNLANRGLCPGMISASTGRAVAPDGTNPTTQPPQTTPPRTTPPQTTPPQTTPPVTGPAGACSATYALVSNWNTGFQANVTVKNNGSSTLSGWTVKMTLASGQSINNLWNGVVTGSSGAISVKNAPYNGTLGASGSTTFGFVGNGNGATAPSGISCTSP